MAGAQVSPPAERPSLPDGAIAPLPALPPEASLSDRAFLAEQGDLRAGRTTHGLSLWAPELGEEGTHQPGPSSRQLHLPTGLWLVGLGNLGQVSRCTKLGDCGK